MPLRRRDFLLGSVTALGTLAGCVRPRAAGGGPDDVVIRGGTVFDGTGAEGREGDVVVAGRMVRAVTPGHRGRARLEIDARGLAVAPGFVDIHSHALGTLFDDPRAESVVRQGITTVVAGQDGGSHAPAAEPGERSFATFAAYLGAVAALRPAVNVASMIGLGTVRGAVAGDADRPATTHEMARMEAHVREAIAAGACGASTGLEYAPGAFASREELAALCRPLAAHGLPYATHLRNEDDTLIEAIDEALWIARAAGVPLQVAHLKTSGMRNWGKVGAALARLEDARAAGMDVAFDRYPYIAYATGLTNLWPPTSLDGGDEAFLRRLRDPATAAALRAYALDKVASLGGWDRVQITSVGGAGAPSAHGLTMDRWAASTRTDPYEAAVALLETGRGDVGMVGFGMSEENLERFLAHPLGMVCSDGGAFALDGPARRGHPHPRGLGAFPRVLARYVRERRTLTLAQAIHKMTGLPASRIRARGRGVLRAGAVADILVFDPATVKDEATFAEPFRYPTGIAAVLVNGVVALRDGERAAAGSGEVVRPAPPRA